MSIPKILDITSPDDAKARIGDLQISGPADTWVLISKASSESQGWMKSTKAMLIEHGGVLVQVSTQQGEHVAEALTYIPGASLVGEDGNWRIAVLKAPY